MVHGPKHDGNSAVHADKGQPFCPLAARQSAYFGVAAFGHAVAHTLAYVLAEKNLNRILAEATQIDMLTGWLAFFIFIPLASTSMGYAVRRLGTWWKPIQRWPYAAVILTLLHWASLHNWCGWPPAAIPFAPLAALTLYRLMRQYLRPRPEQV